MTVSYALVAVPWIIFGAALAMVCFLVVAPLRRSRRRPRRSRWPTATPGGEAGRSGPARRERYPSRVVAGARFDREQSAAPTGRGHNAPESTQARRP